MGLLKFGPSPGLGSGDLFCDWGYGFRHRPAFLEGCCNTSGRVILPPKRITLSDGSSKWRDSCRSRMPTP